ncbi:Ferric reduction oxidase 8, partial [Globisporangium splendens]
MAPQAAAVELTPNPMAEFSVLKTPENNAAASQQGPNKPAVWTTKYWYLGTLAQFLVLGSMFLYFFGQFAYATPAFWTHLKLTMTAWWGKRTEMGRPTYLFFFCVFPFVIGLMLTEFLRSFNARRLTSKYILKVAQVLRRKPRFGNWVSWYSYGEWLFLAFIIAGNVLVFYYNFHRRHQNELKKKKPIKTNKYLDMIGNTSGFVCLYNMVFLFLPATRNSPWMEFLNISYANGIKYHRWFGMLTLITAVAHCAVFYWLWIREKKWTHEALPCFNCSLIEGKGEGYDRWINVFGEIALILFIIMSCAAIPWVRRNFYNVFYYTHQLFALSIVFTILHWGGSIWFLLSTFLLYMINRAISSSNAFVAVEVKEFTLLSSEFVKIVVSRSAHRGGDFQVGQFVYLNVPAISKLQWHPFTIASSPHSNATSLTILMKSLGDWTNELVQYCDECKQNNVLPTVYMDGYYGASWAKYEDFSTVCLIGGGVGVTPLFSILEDIATKLSHHEPLRQKVYFVFTFRELSLLEEIHPLLMKIKEMDPQEQYFTLMFSLTRVPTDEMLDRAIDHDRLHGNSNLAPTHYSTAATTRQPFTEPLRSPGSRSLMYLFVFAVAVLIVAVMQYGGGKIEVHNASLWPVQNFVEIMLVITCAALTYGFVYYERVTKSSAVASTVNQKGPEGAVALSTPQMYSSDLHCFRDLVAHYNVAVGHRPDLQSVLGEVLNGHKSFVASQPSVDGTAIGLFVSGPESLKSSVDYAVADLGSHNFDVHTEEFEL